MRLLATFLARGPNGREFREEATIDPGGRTIDATIALLQNRVRYGLVAVTVVLILPRDLADQIPADALQTKVFQEGGTPAEFKFFLESVKIDFPTAGS